MSANKVLPLVRGLRTVSKVLRNIGVGFLGILLLLDTGDVIGRYVFNRPITGTMEISQLLMAGIVFFGWAYTLYQGGHITVDIVYSHFPAPVQWVVGLLTRFLSLVIFSLITWQATVVAVRYWHANRLMSGIYVPLYPFQLFVSLGALVLCLELIIQILSYFQPQMAKED